MPRTVRTEPRVSPDLVVAHGLTTEEYGAIRAILKRDPTYTELGIFSVMWSEHCSYKSSRIHLKTLPTAGPRILQGPGENAGVVDIGCGLAAVFKIESHNHPSFIEPYQGAATGVGGIIRDVFTMGARPICLLDSLRFGPLTDAKSRYLLGGVVAGIAGYGNAVGVPTVGGEVAFAGPYAQNPLVNVLCLGIAPADRIFTARAGGPGNPVIYVGAKTGRDGIHGATMASETFDETSEERRPTVQVGDPFREKLLIEACLELMGTGEVVGIQDMGAAGLTCSSCEMASRGGTGIELELDRVPRREEGMTPYEVMLSESQERMLVVARQGAEEAVRAIFAKWDLDAVVVGRVTDDGMLRVLEGGKVVAEIPARPLAEGAPADRRPATRPAWLDALLGTDLSGVPPPADWAAALTTLLASPAIACKRDIWRQYDHMLYLNTIVLPGSDAVVLRLKGHPGGLALSTDGNGRYCFLDPYVGGMIAVAEAARNVSCAGAEPVALTNCLNFGDPTRPEVMWQFGEVIRGMGEACRALGTPVTGGNVSFYNETLGRAIFPTPIVGMLGLLADIRHATTQWFKRAGDLVYLLGETRDELGGSEYITVLYGREEGRPPALDLGREQAVQETCRAAIRAGCVRSAHDTSEGGLAVALAECCIPVEGEPIGFTGTLPGSLRPEAAFFAESQSRIVISVRPDQAGALEGLAQAHGVPCTLLGSTGGATFTLTAGPATLRAEVAALAKAWRGGLRAAAARGGDGRGA